MNELIKIYKLAKFFRIISIPSVTVIFFILVLTLMRPDIFFTVYDIFVPIIFLGIIPTLAYPLQQMVPKYREAKREGQRNLAFICSLIGYTVTFIWSLLNKIHQSLLLICCTYFLSTILLIIFNKFLNVKASGHSCSVTGPLIFVVYLIDWKFIFPCLIYGSLVAWSSLYLKRHTKKELLFGIVLALVSFLISNYFINLRLGEVL